MQHQNQEAEIGVIVLTRYRTYLDFISFYMSLYICVCMCVHACVCSSVQAYLCMDSTAPAPQTDRSCCPSTAVPAPPLSSATTHPGIHSHSVFILRMLYKWRHTVCNLLRLAFSTNTIPMRSIQVLMCISSLLLFYHWAIFHCMVVLDFIWPFTWWRIFELFPVWSYYK